MGESIREQFEAAWEESEQENEPIPEDQPTPEATPEEPPPEEPAEPEPDKKPEEDQGDKPAPEDKNEPEPKPEEAATDKKTQEKAPVSWSPGNREKWGDLPAEVKQQITKREQEIDLALKKSSDSRKVADTFMQTVEPFKQGLQAAGYQDPFTAINTLFQAEATLRGGSQQQKAQQVAQLIQNYGVDIQTLDTMLAGQPAPTSDGGGNPDIERLIDERMQPVNQYLQTVQQREQQMQMQRQQQAVQAVESFDGEFLSDVRLDMADLMEMAAKRGVPMTIEEAYDKACAVHPEVGPIMKQREEQKRLMGTTAEARRKKQTASASLTGRQRGEPAPSGNESRRETIEQLWNEQVG